MKKYCILIPAVKKNVAFPDDLVKKMNGIPLIQICLNTAQTVCSKADIFVVTDSEEICLMCDRNEIESFYEKTLDLYKHNFFEIVRNKFSDIYHNYKNIILLWPYTPSIDKTLILDALNNHIKLKSDILVSVKEDINTSAQKFENLTSLTFDFRANHLYAECRAFTIIKAKVFNDFKEKNFVYPYVLKGNHVEIKNYQDWWVCEKLLKRKRIIFRIIGNDIVGMGHIYRSLSLAHEITDHEIIFMCDEKDKIALNRVSDCNYLILSAASNEIEQKIIALKPDLVINDIINTTKEYIKSLKENDIKCVNFEDLGEGAKFTDITINELYDIPVIKSHNIKWGNNYFFLRDEFLTAIPHRFKSTINSLLITFGGTDKQNLTLNIFKSILPFCSHNKIKIYIVCGMGYSHKTKLINFINLSKNKNIEYTFATGIMSKIMEKTQIAISSNGRTVYELAHMNIPSIIVSQHKREKTHLFSKEENGFINVGLYKKGCTENIITHKLKALVDNNEYRKNLFDNIKKFNFIENKKRVVKMILKLLSENNE